MIADTNAMDFRRALDSHTIVSVSDASGRIVEVNDLFCEISGYGAAELLGQDHRLMNSDFHPKEFFGEMWRTIRAGKTWHGTMRNRRKDGGFFWVKTTIMPCIDDAGRPHHYIAIRTDVTSLVAAEEGALLQERRLQQAQSILADIIRGDPVPTFVINSRHMVTHWNNACEIVTGIKSADMVRTGDQWRAFYPEARPVLADLIVDGTADSRIADRYYHNLRHSACVPGAYEAEGFFANLGGSDRWLFFTAAPLHDLQGRIIGAIETLQDVTAQKAAEESLRNAGAELERLVEKRTQQLLQANALLEEDMRIRKANEAELQRRYADLSELNETLRGMQEQLLQSEKLASIGQLAAGVAHEINNPIGFVSSNLGSLERYLRCLFQLVDVYARSESGLEKETRDELQRVKDEVDFGFLREDIPTLLAESKDGVSRVRKIVEDLKDFSRAGENEEWHLADLHRGLESTLNVVWNELKYKADVIKEYGTIPEIECLPSRLNQVFMNLLVNAAQAMPSGTRGRITLRTGAAETGVWVEISDTGRGIAAEHLGRIFDPFFTTKPVGQGTGLGLSLSYGIVRQHGGDFEVRSEVGKGTTFRLTLPVTRRRDANPAG